MGLVKFSIKSNSKNKDFLINLLSHSLTVDEDTISFENGYVWTEIGFDSLSEAQDFSNQAENSLRIYLNRFPLKNQDSINLIVKYPKYK